MQRVSLESWEFLALDNVGRLERFLGFAGAFASRWLYLWLLVRFLADSPPCLPLCQGVEGIGGNKC
jgi:hypothetical protein